METKLTCNFLEEKGFKTYTVGEYFCCMYAIESEDKKTETDIYFWVWMPNIDDIQLKIWQIDKSVKRHHVNKLMLDVPVNDVEHAKRFLNAFDINILN